ncbi:Type 1 glutamine amidotransferase-like domain-containing protein, partial [Fusobacterium periodonticum]
IYIGESAGAIITSKDIEYSNLMDDVTIAKDLKEYSGLNLVDFYMVPHLNEFPFEEISKQIVKKYKEKLNIIAINNSQAIIVKDGKFEIK